MKRSVQILMLIALAAILAACSGLGSERQVSAISIQITAVAPPPPGDEPHQFKPLEKGTISLHGFLTVLDPVGIMPGPDDDIYLVALEPGDTEPENIPQFKPGNTPQADVDERSGEFLFTGIAPGRWLVVVETINGAQIPARLPGGLAIFTLTETDIDQIVELGSLKFP